MNKNYLFYYLKKLFFLLICAIFLLLYYFSSRDIGRAKALIYPNFIMLVFGFILLWNIIDTILKARKEISKGINKEKHETSTFWEKNEKSIVIFVSAIIFIYISQFLGFWIATFLYITFLSYYLGIRNIKYLIPQSIIITAILYGIFGLWLKLPLPEGLLF